MAKKRAVGEGTIYRRQDGRYEVALRSLTTAGTYKRIRKYARTRAEADELLTELKRQVQQGVPVPDKTWRLDEFLTYWLESVVKRNRRPSTYSQYEVVIRKYLAPGLGRHQLTRLSVAIVQQFLNVQLDAGASVRQVQLMRAILSSALTRARREELVSRNVAQLVELPMYERPDRNPWSADEAIRFTQAAEGDPLYPAFVLLGLYGLRRGEVLGLRWCDVDLPSRELRIRQQLQRIHKLLYEGPVKTRAGKRTLPLVNQAVAALRERFDAQVAARQAAGDTWRGSPMGEGLIFTTRSGLPIEPRNLARSFQHICERAGVRHIRLHDIRHTTATLLKKLGVPPRDVQMILGHSRISTTLELYEHGDMEDSMAAIEQVEALLSRGQNGAGSSLRGRQVAQFSRQIKPSGQVFLAQKWPNNSGGIGGARTPDLANVNRAL
jgi:integrase